MPADDSSKTHASVETAWPDPQVVKIADLTLDEALFPRESLNEETVAEYAELMKEKSASFPPVRAIRVNRVLLLIDGWHRIAAARKAGYTALSASIKDGSRNDAVEAAATSNVRRGLQRTHADKHKAVQMLLTLSKWANASDREIARHCGISHPTVAAIRSDLSGKHFPDKHQPTEIIPAAERVRRFVKRGDQEYSVTMPTKTKAKLTLIKTDATADKTARGALTSIQSLWPRLGPDERRIFDRWRAARREDSE